MPIEFDTQSGKVVLDMTDDEFMTKYEAMANEIRKAKAKIVLSEQRIEWNRIYYQKRKVALALALVSSSP